MLTSSIVSIKGVDIDFERIEIEIQARNFKRIKIIDAENKLDFVTEVRSLLLWLAESIK